jgi:hypothetical protein
MFAAIKVICKCQISHPDLWWSTEQSITEQYYSLPPPLSLSFTTTLFTLDMQNYQDTNIFPQVEVADEDRPRPTKKNSPHLDSSRGFKTLVRFKQVHTWCCYCTPTSLSSYKQRLLYSLLNAQVFTPRSCTELRSRNLPQAKWSGRRETPAMHNTHMVRVPIKHGVTSTVLSRRLHQCTY